jgi:hypothetical protein
MFTSKANSKQKWVEKHKKRRNRNSVSTKEQNVGTARAMHGTAVLD